MTWADLARRYPHYCVVLALLTLGLAQLAFPSRPVLNWASWVVLGALLGVWTAVISLRLSFIMSNRREAHRLQDEIDAVLAQHPDQAIAPWLRKPPHV